MKYLCYLMLKYTRRLVKMCFDTIVELNVVITQAFIEIWKEY